MNTATATVPTRLSSLSIDIDPNTYPLMAGDTIHLEVTLRVDTVTSGVSTYDGKPYITYGVSNEAPGVVRCAASPSTLFDRFGTKKGVVMVDQGTGDPVEITDAVPYVPTRRERITARIKGIGSWLWACPTMTPRLFVGVLYLGCVVGLGGS